MQDGNSAINDLVTAKAAELKEQGGENNQGQKKEEGSEGSNKDVQLTPEQITANEAEAKKVADEAAAKAEAEKKEEKPDPLAELLKETKFESLDALKAHLTKKDEKQKSPEELKREEDVYRANLNNYAVENQLMSNDDIVKLEVIKGKADKDIVFESFSSEVKDEIVADLEKQRKVAGITDELTPAEIAEAIDEAFEKEYPLNSDNDKAKKRAENKLAKAAKEMRGPLESSFTEAKTRYDSDREVKAVYPVYVERLNKLLGESVSEKLTLYTEKDGDADVAASIDLTPEERKSVIEKAFKKTSTPEMFKLFQEKKFDKMAEILKEETDGIIWKDYRSRALAKVAEVFTKHGTGKGSDTGAKQSFETNQAKAAASNKVDTVSAEQQVIEGTRQKKQ
jgi:hypothetical protein